MDTGRSLHLLPHPHPPPLTKTGVHVCTLISARPCSALHDGCRADRPASLEPVWWRDGADWLHAARRPRQRRPALVQPWYPSSHRTSGECLASQRSNDRANDHRTPNNWRPTTSVQCPNAQRLTSKSGSVPCPTSPSPCPTFFCPTFGVHQPTSSGRLGGTFACRSRAVRVSFACRARGAVVHLGRDIHPLPPPP